MAINDFVQIAHGGAAIVEPQNEWAGESGILNNGFPTGIVLQEQYNKAWRQATAALPSIGAHLGALLAENVTDDGNLWKLWCQLWRAALVEGVFIDAYGVDDYTVYSPDGNLPWPATPRIGTAITLWVAHPNTGRPSSPNVPPRLSFMGSAYLNIVQIDYTIPKPGAIYGVVQLLFDGSQWLITSMNAVSARSEGSFGTAVDQLGGIADTVGAAPGVYNFPYDTSLTYTVPANTYLIQPYLYAGGGGTATSQRRQETGLPGASCGGGGGGCCILPPIVCRPGDQFQYIVGSHGFAAAYGGSPGSKGANTYWGSSGYIYATGGYDGSQGSIGAQGSANGGLFNLNGNPGAPSPAPNVNDTRGGVGGRAGGPHGGGGGSSGDGSGGPGGIPGGGAGGPGCVGNYVGAIGGHGVIFVLR